MNQANGWQGSGASADSDQIWKWDGSGFAIHWLRANKLGTIEEWRNLDSLPAVDNMYDEDFFDANEAFFIFKQTEAPDFQMNLVPPTGQVGPQ
jgi:hypothetical protein